MKSKKICLSINNYYQSLEILDFYKSSKIKPIFYFKYNLIDRLGIEWLCSLIIILEKKYGTKKFSTCVDVKKNYGLFINLVDKKINYLEVKANTEILKKLKSIAKINKVLINPNFSIVDLTKSKNIKIKIRNLR